AELLASTGLAPFADRLARKLSGGMRLKLGICCALIHDPDFLILDEPTTGVDPLSRRQFWNLIGRMRAQRSSMSVLVATAYMEEAEAFDWLVAMEMGRVITTGSPREIKSKTQSSSIEEAFVALLPEKHRGAHRTPEIQPRKDDDHEAIIVARELTRRFGDFTAVDHVNFTIERGEIFGFVGPNGSGKTTTMKMLTGLLPATDGEALLFGHPVNARDMRSRYRVGYMSQLFSLYTELTVKQNLDLHARLFHLSRDRSARRIDELADQFGLDPYLNQEVLALPLGIRQRLSLAVAIVHEPELLILDEPTSGVDPLARDQFWELLIDLSRNQGVTIFVSTHFMNEAARCDRISLMDEGRVLATGSPHDLSKARGVETLEDAFISFLEEERGREYVAPPAAFTLEAAGTATPVNLPSFSFARLFAYAIREALELLRDPIRLSFALIGSAVLMLIFGFGISTDVDNLSFAVLDRDGTPESRAYVQQFTGSRYFTEKQPIKDYADLEHRLQDGNIGAAIELPPGFGRDIMRGRTVSVAAWIDGAMPFRAETVRGYIEGTHQKFVSDLEIRNDVAAAFHPVAEMKMRFLYNQDFDSVYAMVPATLALLLTLIPATLMALAIVREKELGSITNLYVTPVTRIEFLLGKQLPYIALAMVNFGLMVLMALFIFGVPLKGSFLVLVLGAFLYVAATTSYGMLISAFARTQIAALFGTTILTILPAMQFSGMLTPVSSLAGAGAYMGRVFPMSYFLPISVGTFTKGLGIADLSNFVLELAIFFPTFIVLSLLLLRRQER
ncbi:MAG TPA: ribosome-associated ATPase/putative transporter RbbA, partial [Blastocatellia bacterium]|nr:ribosome-associated ATPase/putative transporter RbbA [Blastocatellia bacterium]